MWAELGWDAGILHAGVGLDLVGKFLDRIGLGT